MWKCPVCKEKVENLSYNVDTTGSESGYADLDDIFSETDRILDHNSEDYGESEWNGDVTYSCPECGGDIDPDNLKWVEEEEEKEKIEEEEEESHTIIKPEKNIISGSRACSSDKLALICKKCYHICIYSTEESYDSDISCGCQKCGTENSVKEYKQLLKDGYYKKQKNVMRK